MRWIVGDVQGCARELDDLLRTIRFDPGSDELWCLGDLVNRGPDSLGALRLWRDVGGQSLLGNHDVNSLLTRAHRRPPRPADTLDDLFRADDADELFGLLRDLPILVSLPGGDGVQPVWLVHAGLSPLWDDLEEVARRVNGGVRDDDWLESPDVSFATRVRCCAPDGRRCSHSGSPESCPPPFVPWDTLYAGETLVVHGKSERRSWLK